MTAEPRSQRLGDDAERHRRRNRCPSGEYADPQLAGGRGGFAEQSGLADPTLADQQGATCLTTPRRSYRAKQEVQLDLSPGHDGGSPHAYTATHENSLAFFS